MDIFENAGHSHAIPMKKFILVLLFLFGSVSMAIAVSFSAITNDYVYVQDWSLRYKSWGYIGSRSSDSDYSIVVSAHSSFWATIRFADADACIFSSQDCSNKVETFYLLMLNGRSDSGAEGVAWIEVWITPGSCCSLKAGTAGPLLLKKDGLANFVIDLGSFVGRNTHQDYHLEIKNLGDISVRFSSIEYFVVECPSQSYSGSYVGYVRTSCG